MLADKYYPASAELLLKVGAQTLKIEVAPVEAPIVAERRRIYHYLLPRGDIIAGADLLSQAAKVSTEQNVVARMAVSQIRNVLPERVAVDILLELAVGDTVVGSLVAELRTAEPVLVAIQPLYAHASVPGVDVHLTRLLLHAVVPDAVERIVQPHLRGAHLVVHLFALVLYKAHSGGIVPAVYLAVRGNYPHDVQRKLLPEHFLNDVLQVAVIPLVERYREYLVLLKRQLAELPAEVRALHLTVLVQRLSEQESHRVILLSRRLEFALEFHLERVSFEVYALNGGVRLVEPLVESLLIRVQSFAQDVYLIHQRFVA